MSTSSSIPVQIASVEPAARPRIASIDVFRGLVMFLMLFQIVQLPKLATKEIERGRLVDFWETIRFHTSHVEWEGGSLHDMIQPGFSFLVGTAMAFSLANRQRRGQSWWRMLLHVLLRTLVLVMLGVLLRNLKTDAINFRFEDTLCQIGLGYTFLFLVASLPRVWHYLAIGVILLGWWLAFVAYPLPEKDFDTTQVGVPADWPHNKVGVAAHWNKNTNLVAAFDRWFLNKFPRETPFVYHDGGYGTLNFIPTLATMLLGLLAGTWLRDEGDLKKRLIYFLSAIAIGWGGALLIDWFGLCPIIKRLWTPSWVLWSGGWCMTFLLAFHLICDVLGWSKWAFFLTVIGANSIAAYVMYSTTLPFIRDRLDSWIGFLWRGAGDYSVHVLGLVSFCVLWLILYWMNRNKIFIRI